MNQKEYPLPTIDEILQDSSGFTLASVVGLNMGYLSILLCADSRKLTSLHSMVSLKVVYYQVDIKPVSDIFQSHMVGVFQPMTIRQPRPYINDIFHGKGNTFKEHLTVLDETRMQVNLEKSTLCSKSVEFQGFNVGQK